MYQKNNAGKFELFDVNLSKSTSNYKLESGLYISITDIVEAMNTLIQERNNHNETCITVKVSHRTQKVVIMLANETSGLAFCSTDLVHIFGNKVGNGFGVLMIGKGPHEPEFAYDIVRIHSLMICATVFRQYSQLFYEIFTTATESGKSIGCCNFRNNLPINIPNFYGGKSYVF